MKLILTDDLVLEFKTISNEPYHIDIQFANKLLREYLEQQPVVYGFYDTKFGKDRWAPMDDFPNKNPDHKTRTIGPVPIVKDTERSLLEEFLRAVSYKQRAEFADEFTFKMWDLEKKVKSLLGKDNG